MTTLEFVCNGVAVSVDAPDGASLLDVVRDQLAIRSVQDGCAPQGQCGCCTVLVDGAPRVACVTPATRVAGRTVTTVEGLDPTRRDDLTDRFLAHGASQCGFCTPGILVRCAGLLDGAAPTPAAVDKALAAHLCRCTGWQGIVEALTEPTPAPGAVRDLAAASRRATIEGRTAQAVGPDVVLGHTQFAADTAPADALVAIVRPEGSTADAVAAAGVDWVVADTLAAARAAAGTVQGRRTTLAQAPPVPAPTAPPGGVAFATSFVEPAYLEPDASWCEPGGVPASPLANGGAFGAKTTSVAPAAARALADHFGRAVRTVLRREDVVRLGPKRPPLAAAACADATGTRVRVESRGPLAPPVVPQPHGAQIDLEHTTTAVPGPPVAHTCRAPWAETALLAHLALRAAGIAPAERVTGIAAAVALDSVAADPDGGVAGAHVDVDDTGRVTGIHVRVAAGAVLDEIVLRSYCVGAVHMALGWAVSEALTVDPDTGAVLDLTIRSFGIVRPGAMPPVTVEIVPDDRPPCNGSDAVFVATAAAVCDAITRATGACPDSFPARNTVRLS